MTVLLTLTVDIVHKNIRDIAFFFTTWIIETNKQKILMSFKNSLSTDEPIFVDILVLISIWKHVFMSFHDLYLQIKPKLWKISKN